MRKNGWLRSAIVTVMLSMFLVGTINVAFRPVFSEEVKYEGEPSTIENPPLNVTVQKAILVPPIKRQPTQKRRASSQAS